MTTICAWCEKVKFQISPGVTVWLRVALCADVNPKDVSHGICPPCLEIETIKTRKLREEKLSNDR